MVMRHKAVYPGILVLVVLALSSLFLINPRPKIDAQSTSTCCGTNPPTAPREIVFPYYSLADGFNSTLLLVSDSGDPLDFIVAVHSLTGQTQLSNSMTIQPGAKLPIDMRSLLTSLGADVTGTFSQGSVSVFFEGTIMPLLGQMTMENPSRHWVQQAEMVENDPGRTDIPPVLSGQWWGFAGGRDATIMVANSSGNIVTADVFLAFGGNEHGVGPMVFNPYETKRLSVADMLASLKLDVAQAPEGRITIIQRGPNPALVAQGRVTDPVTGFSTTLEFPDPAHERSSALHASGIPVGTPSADSPYAGDGTFTPHVIISNLSSQSQSVTITAEYPEGAKLVPVGEKEFDGESGTAVGQMTLATLQVPADSTEDFSLAAEIGQLPLPIPYASLRIQYSGAPGSMIAQVSSVDEQQDLVVDARTANERDGWAGSGVNPWHVDNQTNSILFLTNESDKSARIGFRVTAGGVTYWLTNLELKPRETRSIDFRKLRDAQQADFKGNKIPAGATDGSVSWIRLDGVAVEGRLMVIQKEQGMASSYDCEACSCPASFSSLSVAPASFGIIPTAYQDMSDTGTYHSCNGSGNFYYNLTVGSNWTSNNTPVIQMNSSIHYRAVGMAGGTANVNGCYTDCSMYDTNPDFDCPCISWPTRCSSGAGQVIQITGISPSRGLIGATTIVTINGSGFGSSPTVNAGSGITFSYSSRSATQIIVNFVVASTAPSGNHSVTVTNNSVSPARTSSSVNFYVQVPKKLVRLDYPGAPGGVGPLVVITNGNVVDLSGHTIATGQCGVYRNYAFQLVDQETSPQPISGTYTITAHFTNYQGPGSTPSDNSQQITPGAAIADLQYFGNTAPSCPGSNDNESFDMFNFVNVGTSRYDLTTVIHISKGYFSGTPEVNSTITTP
jgi:IPT/TIG domain